MKKVFIIFLLASGIIAAASRGVITVHNGGAKFDLAFRTFDGVHYTTSDEFAKLSDNRFYSAIKRKESISLAGATYIFSPFNRFVVVSERTYDIGLPTMVTGDELYIPLIPLLEIMADRSGLALAIDGENACFISKRTDAVSDKEKIIEPAMNEVKQEKPDILVSEDKNDEIVIKKAPIVEPLETEKPRKTRWSVMIDPGHGGLDPGASAKDGTREKTIVLEISKKLVEFLDEDTLFTSSLSRNEDEFLPLKERTSLANSEGADIFLSIHCNASKNPAARGTQCFFLAPASSDQARATAALENASIFLEDDVDTVGDLDFIMADLIQNEFLRESSRLAVHIEEAISEITGLPARGPAGAGFYVLKGSFMPAVLVEAAFISNSDDAALLKKEAFRKKIAEGIAIGLRNFILELPE